MSAELKLSVTEVERLVTVALAGELNMSGARRVQEVVQRPCEGGCEHLVIDLRELSFIDSGGVRALLGAVNTCAEHYCRLEVVRCGQEAPRRALGVLGLEDVLPWRGEG
jgi:anti-anti-sigma factor